MRFIIGESLTQMIHRIEYRGVIGLFYNSTIGGLLSYLIFAVVCILALIGLATVVIMISKRKQKKAEQSKDPYREWVKSGKYK